MTNAIATKRAFTLIELLIVIALIALMGVLALPAISTFFRVSLKSTTRKLASLIANTYQTTVLTGKVHRFVFDLKTRSYWVEWSPKKKVLLSLPSEKKNAPHLLPSEKKKHTKIFQLAKSILKKKHLLPDGVFFKDIITEQGKITQGKAYSHFFPSGIIEKTWIHLEDSQKHQTTLFILPFSGKIKVFYHYVEKDELEL